MKQCIKCDCFLTLKNWYNSSRIKHHYVCKNCIKKESLSYLLNHQQERKEYLQKWRKLNPEYRKKYYIEHGDNERAQAIDWQKNNPEKHCAINIKSDAKRKRNLNWILMSPNPFAENVVIDYHHITDVYVVAIPRELHQLYGGKSHREKIMDIVKQIYMDGE